MLPVIGPVNLKLLLTLFVPLYCGILYSYRGRGGRALIPGVLWMVPTLWIAWQIPSATMVITLLMSYAICLSIAVYRGWFCISVKKTLIAIWSVMVCMPILGTLLILWFGREYQIARLQAFAGVNVSTEGNSFVISNLQRILRESHLLGGSSVREVYTEALPDPGSFVLPFLTSYYGILVAVAVVAMLLFLLCSMMKKSLRQRNQVGMLMSSGCCVVFFVETFFWLLSNLGIVYIDSFCPFLNYGGTGTLVTYIMLGIILSVYRNENVLPVHIRVGQKSKTRLDL